MALRWIQASCFVLPARDLSGKRPILYLLSNKTNNQLLALIPRQTNEIEEVGSIDSQTDCIQGSCSTWIRLSFPEYLFSFENRSACSQTNVCVISSRYSFHHGFEYDNGGDVMHPYDGFGSRTIRSILGSKLSRSEILLLETHDYLHFTVIEMA